MISVPDSSQLDRPRLRRALGHPVRARPDPQPLRRPHVHPPDAGGARPSACGSSSTRCAAMLAGRRVVVVDDSIVRGTTSRKLVRCCAGPARARSTSASARRRSPTRASTASTRRAARELIGARQSCEEIARFLDVDSIGYLSLEGHAGLRDATPRAAATRASPGSYPIAPERGADKLALEGPRRAAPVAGARVEPRRATPRRPESRACPTRELSATARAGRSSSAGAARPRRRARTPTLRRHPPRAAEVLALRRRGRPPSRDRWSRSPAG